MKTAEKWCQRYWQLKSEKQTPMPGKTPSIHEWDILVHEIQLDAMKEGMRRAASIAPTEEQLAANMGDAGEQRIGVIDYKDRILTAAEQLTEKDLQ